jgi:hypothetical protein
VPRRSTSPKTNAETPLQSGLRSPSLHTATVVWPAPGGQPDPHPQTGRLNVEQLRWTRCADDEHLYLPHAANVLRATASGHAPAVYGQRIPAEGLTITSGPSGRCA